MASLLAGDPGDMQGMILAGLLESCTWHRLLLYSCLSWSRGLLHHTPTAKRSDVFVSGGRMH